MTPQKSPPPKKAPEKVTPFDKLKAKVTFTKAPPPLFESAQAMLEITLSHALVLTAKHVVARICRDLDPATGQSPNIFPLGEMTPDVLADQVMHQIETVRHCEIASSDLSKVGSGVDKRIRVSLLRGFNEAYTLLDSVGALALDGVREEIDKTRDIILSQFVSLEQEAEGGADPKEAKAKLASKLSQLWAGNE